MRIRYRILALMLCLLGLLSPGFAEDYAHLLDRKVIRWNDQTVTILVHIEDGTGLAGWNPENIRAVQNAFSEWEVATGRRFRFLYMPDHRGTDVIVSFKAFHDRFDRGDEAGVTKTVTWGNYVAENNIELYLHPEHDAVYTPAHLQSIALHEIGHMLGINGHSNDPRDVMYPASTFLEDDPPQHLTQRDVDTLRAVYLKKADYANPEGVRLSNFDQFKKAHPGRHISLLWVMIGPVPVPIPLPF